MKKYLELIFLLIFTCLSFFYTKKTVSVVKEYDDLMIKIKNQKEQYESAAENAIINKNTIIPGISGTTINVDRSYSKMKRYGSYNSNLLVYQKTKPKISITNNKNKYIIKGNPKKNMISLIFLIKNNKNINKLLNILNKKQVKTNLFVKNNLLENEKFLNKLIKQKQVVNNLDYNSSFAWINDKIKSINNKRYGFCYLDSTNTKILKKCIKYKNYTVIPNIKIKDKPLIEIKKQIESGSIISFELNDIVLNELGLIIEYIKSKGYLIEPLSIHMEE